MSVTWASHYLTFTSDIVNHQRYKCNGRRIVCSAAPEAVTPCFCHDASSMVSGHGHLAAIIVHFGCLAHSMEGVLSANISTKAKCIRVNTK